MDTADSSVPRSRALIIPQGEIEAPKIGEVIFEKQKYSFVTKEKIYNDEVFGVISMTSFDTEEEYKPETFNTYVEKCKKVLLEKGTDSDFIFICSSGSFLQTRSAVIAAKEAVPGAKVFPLMQFDSNKNSSDSWNALSQLIVLQAMKCDGVVVDCYDRETLGEILDDILPYARIPVALWADNFESVPQDIFAKISCVVSKEMENTEKAREMAVNAGFFDVRRQKPAEMEDIPVVSNGEAWFLDYNMDISEPVICDEYFSENILEIEDEECFIIKVDISTADELDIFETEQYMVKNPVCIYSEDEEIFARAVRMFSGIAIYDGTCEISDEVLRDLSVKYGLVIL